MLIDVSTTATLREDLYEQALASLVNHVHGAEFRLIINIDPVGPGNADAMERIARKYVENVVAFRPETASFPRAQLRVWRAVESEFFLNLEDDWEFLVDVDIGEMIEVIQHLPDFALLRFSRWESTDTARQWNKRVPWNGYFFEVPSNLSTTIGFSGNPSLIRRNFIIPLLHTVSTGIDIEKQLKGYGIQAYYLRQWRYGIWQRRHSPATIKDIGTPWRQKHRWAKHPRSKISWTTWQKMEGGPDANAT